MSRNKLSLLAAAALVALCLYLYLGLIGKIAAIPLPWPATVALLGLFALGAFLVIWRGLLGRSILPRENVLDSRAGRKELEAKLDAVETDLNCVLPTVGSDSRQVTIIPVVGARHVGKSSLVRELDRRASEAAHSGALPLDLDLQVSVPLSSVADKNEALLERWNGSALAILVVTKDLTDYEYQALFALATRGATVVVVLNKTDVLSQREQAEIAEAIRSKLCDLPKSCPLVTAAAAPIPTTRVVRHPDGSETQEETSPTPKVTDVETAIMEAMGRRTNSTEEDTGPCEGGA